jgi:glucose dehydrogenase
VVALGAIVLLLGAVPAIMGARLVMVGGSWYYVIAGSALAIAITLVLSPRLRGGASKVVETLWSDALAAGGQAAPVSYEARGEQYLVIMAVAITSW